MVGESLKRPYPGNSEPKPIPRKIARFDHGSAYQSNGDLSNPSSRRSSMSQTHPPDQTGYNTPRSRSPARNGNTIPRYNIEGLPRTLESFIVTISKQNQSGQHLKNVEADYENMLPRHQDFPVMGNQRTTRLDLARKDHEVTTAQTAEATNQLLEALKEYFPKQTGPVSHQDCISRSEFRNFTDQFRAEMRELEELRAENREMKSKLGKQEALLNREIHLGKTAHDRLAKLEQDDRRDRLSYGTRFSTLEVEMEKNKTRHKDTTQSIDAVRSLFDDKLEKTRTMYEEQAQKLVDYKSKAEAMQQNLDVKVDSLKDNSETLAATRKDLHELKQQFITLSSTPAISSTTPTPALGELELRLRATEGSVEEMKNNAAEKDEAFANQFDLMQSELDQAQVNLNNLQASIEDEIPGKRGFTEEDLQTFNTWKDLETKVKGLASKNEISAVSANITQLEANLRPQLDFNSRSVENHIDLLQRHEVRLNSVTTDELCKMMENQWCSTYGLPTELRGLVTRYKQLDAHYKQLEARIIKSYQDLNKKVTETMGKCDGLAAQFQDLVKKTVG